MKDAVSNEISNLFQELIVSKIKLCIDELGSRIAEIENLDNQIGESIGKLPKQSGIKRIADEKKDEILQHIDGCFEKITTEKYLKDIVAYLKKQYAFSDNQSLCSYLESLSEYIGSNIDSVMESQRSLDEKISSVDGLLTSFKEELIKTITVEKDIMISSIKPSLDKITASEEKISSNIEAGIAQIEKIQKRSNDSFNILKENTNSLVTATEERNKISEQLNQLEKILEILKIIDKSVGSKNEEDELSINDKVVEIKELVEVLHQKQAIIGEELNDQSHQLTNIDTKLETKIRVLTVMSSVSIIGSVICILLQLFM